jgi:hypothetical protein
MSAPTHKRSHQVPVDLSNDDDDGSVYIRRTRLRGDNASSSAGAASSSAGATTYFPAGAAAHLPAGAVPYADLTEDVPFYADTYPTQHRVAISREDAGLRWGFGTNYKTYDFEVKDIEKTLSMILLYTNSKVTFTDSSSFQAFTLECNPHELIENRYKMYISHIPKAPAPKAEWWYTLRRGINGQRRIAMQPGNYTVKFSPKDNEEYIDFWTLFFVPALKSILTSENLSVTLRIGFNLDSISLLPSPSYAINRIDLIHNYNSFDSAQIEECFKNNPNMSMKKIRSLPVVGDPSGGIHNMIFVDWGKDTMKLVYKLTAEHETATKSDGTAAINDFVISHENAELMQIFARKLLARIDQHYFEEIYTGGDLTYFSEGKFTTTWTALGTFEITITDGKTNYARLILLHAAFRLMGYILGIQKGAINKNTVQITGVAYNADLRKVTRNKTHELWTPSNSPLMFALKEGLMKGGNMSGKDGFFEKMHMLASAKEPWSHPLTGKLGGGRRTRTTKSPTKHRKKSPYKHRKKSPSKHRKKSPSKPRKKSPSVHRRK